MVRPLRVDSRILAEFQAEDTADNRVIADHLIRNLPGEHQASGLESEFYGALSEFIVDVEDMKFNGINPEANSDHRKRFLDNWRSFALGSKSGIDLKDSAKSGLARKLEEIEETPQIAGIPVNEAIKRTGHWLADTYNGRDKSWPEKSRINRDKIMFEDNLGLKEDDLIRDFKIGRPDETDLRQIGVKLLASEAEKAEIVYPLEPKENGFRWGKSETVTQKQASESLSDSIEELLDETAESVETGMKEVTDLLEDETGLKRGDIPPKEYLEMIYYTDLESANPDEISISQAFLEAAKGSEKASNIVRNSAKRVSDISDITKPHDTDPRNFMDSVSDSEDIQDTEVENAVREALLGVERTTDDLGLRKYRSGDKEAYSVTTIIDPFPNEYDEWDRDEKLDFPFHREIDTGGGLFHWKNIYDGEGGRYDSDIIRDYAGLRGTLAHETVFENYVEDADEVKGDTEKYWSELEKLRAGDDDLGPLQDIIEWKEDEEFKVLEYSKASTGFVSNGKELAEKEIEWIENEFKKLETELGLRKENVIAAEREFVHSTDLPWNDEREFSYGGTIDLLYEHESGETWLLDLKTGSMKPNYAIQQAAYKNAVENSDFFDVDEIDRVIIPSIDPETMMYDKKEPVIYTDRPHVNPRFEHEKFLDASNIDLESSEYRENRWRPENWDEEAFYIFARAAEQMEQASKA